MTDHSATPSQVDFPDVPPTEHDLVEWARKLLEEQIGAVPASWGHQRHLWLKSYRLLKGRDQ